MCVILAISPSAIPATYKYTHLPNQPEWRKEGAGKRQEKGQGQELGQEQGQGRAGGQEKGQEPGHGQEQDHE